MVLPSLLTSTDIQLPTRVVKESVRVGRNGSSSCIGSRAGTAAPRCADAAPGTNVSAHRMARRRLERV